MINQQQLNEYFGNVWRQRDRSLDQYQYSGWELISKVLPNERVIDVGCGDNPFKPFIPNLVGIDPAFPEADYQLTLEDYVKTNYINRFNVAYCLGSINFGNRENIEYQISLLMKIMRTQGSRIYWRCNPGLQDHGNNECESIEFYPWSFDEHLRLAELFNFEIIEMAWDSNNRIYAEWVSKNQPYF